MGRTRAPRRRRGRRRRRRGRRAERGPRGGSSGSRRRRGRPGRRCAPCRTASVLLWHGKPGKDPQMADPVFLITGASTGIGAATARHAAKEGYRLVLAARSEDKIAALAQELGGDERALAVPTDVTEWDQVEALVQRTLDAYGRLDV